MKIGIVTNWYPSGAGYVSKAYFESLSRDHEVFIYARGGEIMKHDPSWDQNYVYWAPYHPNGIRIGNLVKWIKKQKPDIIFFNEQRFWKPVYVAKKLGVLTGAYIDYYKQNTVKAFSLYDFLICNTKRHYSVFSWHNNSFYVPWGTYIEKFKPVKRPSRKLTFIHSIGWQGRSTLDRRGTLLLLKAFEKILKDCTLLIYSQKKLEDCLPEIQDAVKHDDRISFIYGTFDPVPYTDGDVFIYPSRLEGIGLTLPEALSSGLPAITTDAPPMNEFVKDGINGTLIKVNQLLGRKDGYYWPESISNIESLVQAMENYFDDEVLLLQGTMAREIAEIELDWRKNEDYLNKIFSEAAQNKISLTPDLIQIADQLDDEMAPSLLLRSKYLIYDFIKMIFNKR